MRRWRTAVLAAPVLAAGLLAAATAPAALADYSRGHDNSTYSAHDYSWTHGDPNTGLAPGNTNDGYYYLKAYADGPFVWCEVYSGGNWLIQLETSDKTVLAQATFSGTGGRVFYSGATAGDLYMCRIANTSPPASQGGQVQKDYAELNSANSGDIMTTGDCGGPGPVTDVNFGGAPMEPAPPEAFANGCSDPTAAPYAAGDPRLSPPGQQTFDLGNISGNTGGNGLPFTTGTTGDLTAIAFFGHQGTSGTIGITDCHGHYLNGTRWGDQAPDPKTMNQEFTGADAGVQPAGTYCLVYTGPSNGTQQFYALEVDYPQP